jgi:PAS domain-containing protein
MSREGSRTEEALTNSAQELRLLVETIPALVWRAGPEGNIEYVNKPCARISWSATGRSRRGMSSPRLISHGRTICG